MRSRTKDTEVEAREGLQGATVDVHHASGESYHGTVLDVTEEGFMLYSADAGKPDRTNGRYFSWDAVTISEVARPSEVTDSAVEDEEEEKDE